jgi:hypothetical protein
MYITAGCGGLIEREGSAEGTHKIRPVIVSAHEAIHFEDVHLRHPHRKAVNHKVVVEWLHDISRDETVVNARVLVLVQLRELVLPYVHHVYGMCVSE